jgi:REP element-mobilizing transposase RayT
MPDHIHLIARQGIQAVTLGEWIKAFKAMACRPGAPTGRFKDDATGRLPSENLARLPSRSWRWQQSFHDHKFRTAEGEARKWEYICLNPVRAGLVTRPELWRFSGEFLYEPDGKSRLVRGTPPLLDRGVLIPDAER